MAARLTGLVVATLLLMAGAAHAGPLRFEVGLGSGARLGHSTSLNVALRMASGYPLIEEVRILLPPGVDLSTSELGMATCVRPAADLTDVLTAIQPASCPHNALMASGSATAQLRFDPTLVYGGAAQLSLYAGEPVGDRPGLIVIANAFRPMRAQLTYRGYLYVPPNGFGLGMVVKVDQIPRPPFGAPLALSSFRLVVGASTLRYEKTANGRPVRYRPRAVPLPASCPSKGFRFRAIVRLADGRRLSDDTHAPCPSVSDRK